MKATISMVTIASILLLCVTGCGNKDYYCNDGDTLIKDTCLHKESKKALICGCRSIDGCGLGRCNRIICSSTTTGLCPNSLHYKCFDDDGELYGDRCVKEETYPAHVR